MLGIGQVVSLVEIENLKTHDEGEGHSLWIEYLNEPECTLAGCVNDVINMAKYLKDVVKMPCDVYTEPGKADGKADALTRSGMLRIFKEAATATYKDKLDLLYIHYSGHGTFIQDKSRDEADCRDECLVPLDFRTKGYIVDDDLHASMLMSEYRVMISSHASPENTYKACSHGAQETQEGANDLSHAKQEKQAK
jgi:hypothetical protein